MMSIMGEVFSLAKLAIPAAAALLGVWLQGRFSRNTAASNRLWDLKRAAYAELLVSLREAEVAANDAAAVFERDGDSSPALQEHYAIYREHQKKLRQRMAADSIILPAAISDHYERAFKDGLLAGKRDQTRAEEARAEAAHLK
jgi:hypothetical protein